jgi:hypothetical protein
VHRGIRKAITKTNPFSTHMRPDLWKGESGKVAGLRIRHATASYNNNIRPFTAKVVEKK